MSYEIDTRCIHGEGHKCEDGNNSISYPIYQTASFSHLTPGHNPNGFDYSRESNPTRAYLEETVSSLEHAADTIAFASGMAAIATVFELFQPGDHIIAGEDLYGGVVRLINQICEKNGYDVEFVDTTDVENIKAALRPNTKGIYFESPTNPTMRITDIGAAAGIAHESGAVLIVDNTFMTPYLQRPIEFGIDIVIHSATKYLGGHSDVVAGLVVVNDDDLAKKIGFIQNSTGGVLAPFDSFLLIRGIKTLAVRLDRHVENAQKAAEFLSNHKAVKKVYYPGLPNAQGYEVNKRQAKNGGVMISFELYENYNIRKFFKSLKLVSLAESLGGVESLVCHPASMTHASIPYEVRQKIGITDGLIRLSIGIENIDDILSDIKQAIEGSEE